MICPWCDESFTPRRSGGKTKKFCAPGCQQAFNDALRRWARNQWEDGALTTETLRRLPLRVERNMHGAISEVTR